MKLFVIDLYYGQQWIPTALFKGSFRCGLAYASRWPNSRIRRVKSLEDLQEYKEFVTVNSDSTPVEWVE